MYFSTRILFMLSFLKKKCYSYIRKVVILYMFNLGDLLELFEDEEIKNILSSSYYLSQKNNKELSDSFFNRLLSLKTNDPDIKIIYDPSNYDPSKDMSCFIPGEKTIYLTELSIGTFFHELTHLF